MDKKNLRMIYGAIIILFILVIINSALLISQNNANNSNKSINTFTANTKQGSVKIESDVTKLVDKVNESVVTIALYDKNDELLGNGSGSVIKNDDGTLNIVTNNHVVDMEDIEKIVVIYANQKQSVAKVLGKDKISDLALLETKVDFDIKVLEIGDSETLKVGEPIIAIGSPLDIAYTGTVTDGIISGLNRNIKIDTDDNQVDDYEMNVIQTNASINPGNSGGPLINMAGQMIGINTIKIAQTGFEGMGFAIPSNEAVEILEQLASEGEVVRPKLGISYQSIAQIPAYARNRFDIPDDKDYGIYIVEVLEDSSALDAGIEAKDIILEINGNKISDVTVFTKVLYSAKVGDKLTLLVYRDGEEIEIIVTL